VLHACKRIKELKDSNSEMREDYQHLLRILTT
jgi:chromosomal replication initiator protein